MVQQGGGYKLASGSSDPADTSTLDRKAAITRILNLPTYLN
jgi:hypothetical protein